ncbi:6-phosphogluconolactonase [Gynuella sunshinyii]|uniref:6-phosphogluconolactonase n=1 Tax=Gynuella sunshinyii YC6258 TaxID=1445510 RepID=A0A0C5VJW3_9GAMM|nr:6-phosphogluconolactonase [Gynuella sunshinyii]AJQ94962.1 6-phosphogluconolactonase/Glucosamine-6-phosphate isomerase/deaminase [Gynuella sunshinyii YC6258]
MNLHEYPSAEALDQALASAVSEQLQQDIDNNGVASMAVSGGSTPKGLFARLSKMDLAWEKVIVTLVDERWVNPEHADSNEKLVRDCLLQNCAVAAQLIGLKNGHSSAEQGVTELHSVLQQLPEKFSVVVLGMGGDGHTASFFPQSPQLAAAVDMNTEYSCCATNPVTAPHERMTLTLPRILSTKSLFLHITGAQKKQIFEQACQAGPLTEYPVRSVIDQSIVDLDVYWTHA